MSLLDSLGPEERARQLRDPVGAAGLAVADALDGINRDGNLRAVAGLALGQGARVLEIGCGTGRMAEVVVRQAADVRYAGLDSSPTMIDAARERNPALVGGGLAGFHCARAERMPFDDASFTAVFSTGVIHFWADPDGAFAEVRRVMRPGALMLMGCLGPERAPPFARAEYGFHLRDPQAWRSSCQRAGFEAIEVRSGSLGPEGGPQLIHLSART